MRKLIIFLVGLFVFSGTTKILAYYGEGCGEGKKNWENRKKQLEEKRKEMQKKRLERLAKELNLTEEQKKEIEKILEDGWNQIKAERKKFREKVKSIREATDKKVENLLNEEQKKKYYEFKGAEKERIKNRKIRRKMIKKIKKRKTKHKRYDNMEEEY